MKTAFIEVTGNKEIKLSKDMKGKVGLVATAQYLHQIKDLNKQIKNSVPCGQVLGCNITNAIKDVDCYLFIGDGRFHAIELARETGKEVFIASGDKITKQDIEKYERQRKGRILKYLNSKKIGILLTTKNQKFGDEKKLRKVMKDKEVYTFISDYIDVNELENFPDIDMFVNTACPRIESKRIINAEEVFKLY